MARPSTITVEEVFAAVAGLVRDGAYPNPTNVRSLLGGRGSPPLVQRYIGLWYKEFGPELARKVATASKKPTTAVLEAELRRLTSDALRDLDAAQAERVASLDARDLALDERQTKLEAQEDALLVQQEKQNDRELAQHELVRKIMEASEEALIAKDEALAAKSAAQEQVAAQAARIVDLERATAHTETLKREVASARADLAREHARVAELVPARDAAVQRANEEAKARSELAGQLAAQEDADIQRLGELAAARSGLGDATTRMALLSSQLETAKKDLMAARSSGATAQSECKELRAARDKAMLKLAEAEARHDALAGVEKVLALEGDAASNRFEALLNQQSTSLLDKLAPLLRKEKNKGG